MKCPNGHQYPSMYEGCFITGCHHNYRKVELRRRWGWLIKGKK